MHAQAKRQVDKQKNKMCVFGCFFHDNRKRLRLCIPAVTIDNFACHHTIKLCPGLGIPCHWTTQDDHILHYTLTSCTQENRAIYINTLKSNQNRIELFYRVSPPQVSLSKTLSLSQRQGLSLVGKVCKI